MKKNKNIFFVRLSHNFLNNAWNNLKFWVSLLFMLVYQSLKFQGNRKHGVLNPSDLPWNTPYTLRKKCYWINSISFQKHVYHGFKSICYRINNIFIGSCSIFLWIHSIRAFGKKCFWFNSIFFSVCRLK